MKAVGVKKAASESVDIVIKCPKNGSRQSAYQCKCVLRGMKRPVGPIHCYDSETCAKTNCWYNDFNPSSWEYWHN